MKNRSLIKIAVTLVLILSAGTLANAQTINLPGRNINLSPGNTRIDYGVGGSIDATRTNTGVQYNLRSNGQEIQIDARAGLDATITTRNLDRAAKLRLISLDEGADTLIRSETDLSAYRNLVLEQCDSIRTITTDDNRVRVAYNQPARFLGIFNTNLNGGIEVDGNNSVRIRLPWYSFLFSKNTSEVESQVETDLSVESNDTSVDIQRTARTIGAVTRAISVNTTPCGTTVENGDTRNPTRETQEGDSRTTTTQPAQNTGVQVSGSLAALAGTYTGAFSVYPGSGGSCVASGTTKFVVSTNGSVAITSTGAGVTLTGSGKVDGNGDFSGSWTYAGQTLNYSGKFSASGESATGTYGSNDHCSGTWSVNR